MGRTHSSRRLQDTQFRTGRLITKLFVGIEAEDQHIVPHDPNNSVQGSALGLRLQQETWLDISPRFYLSADASYGTAFQEYCALSRLGFRATHRFALGLGRWRARQRGVRRWPRWRLSATAEFTLSGGFTGNYLEEDPSGRSRYFIGRPEALGEVRALPDCTAGPAPAVLGLVSACGDIDLGLGTASIALSGRASCVE